MKSRYFIEEGKHYVWERNFQFQSLKGRYNIMCMDGIAYAKKVRGSDVFEILYPKMEEIDYNQQLRIQGHRGLDKSVKIGYNDIMAVLGRIKQVIK